MAYTSYAQQHNAPADLQPMTHESARSTGMLVIVVFIMNKNVMKQDTVSDGVSAVDYVDKQTQALCNLADNENLRALLRNESLPSGLAETFMYSFVSQSKTDNGQAVSILLQGGRCSVSIYDLKKCFKKGFTAMAEVLQQDEQFTTDNKKCRTCCNTVGCYECANFESCTNGGELTYCRECVMEDDRFCKRCNDYLCPSCYEAGIFGACEKCNGIACDGKTCIRDFLNGCEDCRRTKCNSCVAEDGETWRIGEAGNGEYWWGGDTVRCPTCQDTSSEQE